MSTVAVDFDGVIHKYSKGWHDGTIYDEPVEGAFNYLKIIMSHHSVFIFTTRNADDVALWIEHNSDLTCEADGEVFDGGKHPVFFWNERDRLYVTNRKLPAIAYIDDRAIRFVNWHQALKDLGNI